MTLTLVAALLLAYGQEYLSVELSPMAVASGRVVDARAPAPFHLDATLEPGLGVKVWRQHRGSFYWTPLVANVVFPLDDGGNVLLSGGTEGGAALGPGQRLEVGLAVEGGVMLTPQPGSCDGRCVMTGLGVLPSLVGRWRFLERGSLTLGIFARLVVPLMSSHGASSLDRTFYTLLLSGIDVGWAAR